MGRRFRVKPQRLQRASEEMREQAVQLERIGAETMEAAQRLRGMSGMDDVCRSLRRIAQEDREESARMARMANAAAEIGKLYDRAENDIYNNGEKAGRTFARHQTVVWMKKQSTIDPVFARLLK